MDTVSVEKTKGGSTEALIYSRFSRITKKKTIPIVENYNGVCYNLSK